MIKLYPLILLIVLSVNLVAQEASSSTDNETTDAEPSTWKGDVQFGYVSSSGNTETTNLNGKFNIEKNHAKWLHLFTLEAFSSADKNQTTAERYKMIYQLDRKYKDNSYIFINSTYEEDRFSGFNYRATLASGYGKQIYNANKMTLDTEIGLGYRQSQFVEEPLTTGSLSESEALVRVAVKYLWQIAESRSLISNLTIDAGEITTISNFELGFVTMVAGDLSLKVSYEARYTSAVPVGKQKLDTVTSVNLLYAF